MKRVLGLLALAAIVPGCNPLVGAALLAAAMDEPETEDLKIINEPDWFHRSADHHDFKATETYTWHNCGDQALVDGEVTPSCPNDITIRIWDADGVDVFLQTYHAPHCFKGKKDWDPVATAKGQPGDWTIEFTFDITGVRDLIFDITRLGDSVDVHTSEGAPEEEEQEGPAFVMWTGECVDHRTKTESYSMPMGCEGKATVSADWLELSAGSMRLIVKDGEGEVVFDHLFEPGHEKPFTDSICEGKQGTWTVIFEAVDLTARDMALKVEED